MKGLIRVCGAALAALIAAPALAQDRQDAPAGAESVSVVVYTSTARPFSDTLVLRGRTEADRRVEIRAEIAGLVASPPLRKGGYVEAGDVLCELSEGDRTAEMTEAEARLAEAMLNADAAGRLAEKGYTSTAQASSMAAALEQARALVLRARINMERLTINAPFDGLLETDTAELGALLQPGSLCAALIALDPIKLIAYAPERSVDALKPGAPVSARLITGREIEGEIRFVSRSADRDTRTYLVEAEAANPGLEIRDGMTAEIDVKLAARSAHLLPQTALTLNDEGALGVRLADEGRARFVPVEVLRDQTEGVWVAGPPAKADVIVVGQEFVTDGRPIDVEFAEPDLFPALAAGAASGPSR